MVSRYRLMVRDVIDGRMNEEDRDITTKRYYAPAFDAWITSSV